MKYQYCKEIPEKIAKNLQYRSEDKKLTWSNVNGQDVLIVQTPYGSIPFGEKAQGKIRMETICEELNKDENFTDFPECFLEIKKLPGVWLKFTTPNERMPMGGCKINQEASTYTVFSYKVENGVCYIYETKEQPMNNPYIHIKTDIRLKIVKQMRQVETKTGFLGMKRVTERIPSGFYKIQVEKYSRNAYHDGDLYYEVNGIDGKIIEIPVIGSVLQNEEFFIKTEQKPVFKSKNESIKIEITKAESI